MARLSPLRNSLSVTGLQIAYNIRRALSNVFVPCIVARVSNLLDIYLMSSINSVSFTLQYDQ